MALNDNDMRMKQKKICERYGAEYCPPDRYAKVGISVNVKRGMEPLNGLRHPPQGDTTGWYIWSGAELSDDPDFFEPLHVEHLSEWSPQVEKYLGLPPGWRFLVHNDYEDVWYDESLLKV